MNKKNSNMYEGVKTWNPLAGKCPHECEYCSTINLRNRYENLNKKYTGELRLDENAFKKNLGTKNTWFVCAQNDLFAKNTPEYMITKIYNYILGFPNNEYWFQSKNPEKMYNLLNYKYVYGTTIESNFDYRIYKDVPTVYERYYWIAKIKEDFPVQTYITIEPILDFDLAGLVYLIRNAKPNWVNVGADSKRHGLKEPSKEKVLALIEQLKQFTEIRTKHNLERLTK